MKINELEILGVSLIASVWFINDVKAAVIMLGVGLCTLAFGVLWDRR